MTLVTVTFVNLRNEPMTEVQTPATQPHLRMLTYITDLLIARPRYSNVRQAFKTHIWHNLSIELYRPYSRTSMDNYIHYEFSPIQSMCQTTLMMA